MESDSESLKRLLPVANKNFIAMGGNCKGVVMGGLAAALLGSSRKTDVGLISEITSGSLLTTSHLGYRRRRRIFLGVWPGVRGSPHDPWARHLCRSENWCQHRLRCSSDELLLADKVLTFAERGHKKHHKGDTDMMDIKFCIEKMYTEGLTMPKPPWLKRLYNSNACNKVIERLGHEPGNFVFMACYIGLEIKELEDDRY